MKRDDNLVVGQRDSNPTALQTKTTFRGQKFNSPKDI